MTDMLLLLEDSTVRFVSCAKSGGVKDMLLLPKYSSVKFVTFANSSAVRFQVESHSWNGGYADAAPAQHRRTRQLCDLRWNDGYAVAAQVQLRQIRHFYKFVSCAISGGVAQLEWRLLPKYSSVKFVTFTNSSAVRYQVESHSWNGGYADAAPAQHRRTRQPCDFRWR